jgi:uncharacterized protein YecE (DUF72 family)
MNMAAGRIRVGIGGWDFAPWRETFYPADVPQKRQLEYASRRVTSIEVNGTFYRLQTPDTFAKWRDETPDDFMFALKASRFIMNRRALATAGDAIEKFLGSGLAQLGAKLGPILWQLTPFARFDAADLEGFLKLLPSELSGLPLRHALEVRHQSFEQEACIDLIRRYNVATVLADTTKYPSFADATGDFIYARLMSAESSKPEGYDRKVLARWAERGQQWAAGDEPDDLRRIATDKASNTQRDVFLFVINGAKERAPAAAMKILEHLGFKPPAASEPAAEPAIAPKKKATVKRAAKNAVKKTTTKVAKKTAKKKKS